MREDLQYAIDKDWFGAPKDCVPKSALEQILDARRYEMKKSDKELAARMKFLRELLVEFGLTLAGYDPGVLAMQKVEINGGHKHVSVNFDSVEWTWLEPLLIELRDRRKLSLG